MKSSFILSFVFLST